jgi:transglutaminase-like putative cysteine protease
MMKYCCTLLLLLVMQQLAAQVNIYDPSTIPVELRKNASSVMREEHISFDVRSTDKAYYKVHKVVTILNEAGKSELVFYEFTDQFSSLEDLNIEVFDGQGKSRNKYSKDDLARQSAGEGLVPNGKIYYLRVPTLSFPVTIQTDYTEKYNGILNYPDFAVQLPDQAIESSSFSVKVPAELDLRYKARNTTLLPETGIDGKYKTYSWTAKNLPALDDEEGSVSYESRFPRILLAPNKFELDGYPGDMTSWQNFGYWYGSLTQKTVDLSDERKLFFQQLVKDAASDKEKAAIIYNYLQTNCRYVLISLGIGGYKPFEASFVDKKKYGDCKALSNYTQACLAAVGIKSYQALINATYNKEPVDPAFPRNGFNHVIVCIPMQKDSVWLECTSTTNDFGVLGNFTENRNALLITEDGGKLVPTPRSKAVENRFGSYSQISLHEDGDGVANVQLSTSGEYRQDLIYYISNEKKDDQKEFLVNYLGFIQPDEFEIDFNKLDKGSAAKIKMNIEKIPDFTAGSKMFLHPRINKIWTSALPKAEKRTQDFYFRNPFIKTDTTVYKLPVGYSIETLPRAKELKFAYGSYTTSYYFDEKQNSITTTARLELDEYKIPVARYTETKNFFDAVLAEYAEKIVIKKL